MSAPDLPIVRKLLSTEYDRDSTRAPYQRTFNPDGPEAAEVIKKLYEALEDVINPIGKLRRDAEAQGTKLGPMAYSIANDLGFVRSIAKDALSNLRARGEEVGNG